MKSRSVIGIIVIVVIAVILIFHYDPNILNSLGSNNPPSVSIQAIDSNPQNYLGKNVTVTGNIGITLMLNYVLVSGSYEIALTGLPYGFSPNFGNGFVTSSTYTVVGMVEQYTLPLGGTAPEIQVYSIS